jgi:hypothetical protein
LTVTHTPQLSILGSRYTEGSEYPLKRAQWLYRWRFVFLIVVTLIELGIWLMDIEPGFKVISCFFALMGGLMILQERSIHRSTETFWKEIPISDYLYDGLNNQFFLTKDENLKVIEHLGTQFALGYTTVRALVRTCTNIETGDSWTTALGPIQIPVS